MRNESCTVDAKRSRKVVLTSDDYWRRNGFSGNCASAQNAGRCSGRKVSRADFDASGERACAKRRGRLAEFASGRFAAKEAIVKAIGCGIGKQIGFQDVEVLPDGLGKPVCHVREEALQRAGLIGSQRIHISITHTESMAAAYAIVEQL